MSMRMDDHTYDRYREISKGKEGVPPSSNAEAGSLLDETALAQLRALDRPGRPSVVARVLTQYLAAAAEAVEKLREAVRSGDAAGLMQTAHRLKSGSAQVGALSMAGACQELENIGRAARFDGAPLVLERLERQYRGVVRAIDTELTKGKGDQT
jgi:HPt (histidine-containing phosphotransfer) domain-containing protein